MFTMCQRIEKGLEPLRTEFGDFVKNKGLEAVANSVAQNPVADPKAPLNIDFPNDLSEIGPRKTVNSTI